MNSPISSRSPPVPPPSPAAHRTPAEAGHFHGQEVRSTGSTLALAGRIALGILTLGISELSYAVYKTCTRAPADDSRPLGRARQALQAQAEPGPHLAAPGHPAMGPMASSGARIAAAKLDLIETWHSAQRTDGDNSGRAAGEIAEGVRFQMCKTTTKDINRGLVWLEGDALRFQQSGRELASAHERMPAEEIFGANASALNQFMARLIPDDRPEAAAHLATNLSYFIHQGAAATQAVELSQKDYGASRVFLAGKSDYTYEFRITPSDDSSSLRISQRLDYDSIVLVDTVTDERQAHDEIYKSEVIYDVPVAELVRADFDPSCIQVRSAQWGFCEKS